MHGHLNVKNAKINYRRNIYPFFNSRFVCCKEPYGVICRIFWSKLLIAWFLAVEHFIQLRLYI